MFRISHVPIQPQALRAELADPRAGALVVFEGWVRNLNEGRKVRSLEYEAHESMAVKVAERIIGEAIEKHGAYRIAAVHRSGHLQIGDLAVWVGVISKHRGAAFDACEDIINRIKVDLPIWKKEFYEDGDSGWVNCERCAAAAAGSGHSHHHPHSHA
jgi:molybdopterin synthase catalytic subunit